MSKTASEAVAPHSSPSNPVPAQGLLPTPVWIAAALLIIAGGIVLSTRTAHLESSTYDAINSCEAVASKFPNSKSDLNGLSEEFGLVTFKHSVSDVTQYFSLCDTEPKVALAIFRRALTNGNPSAKCIALHSAIFLAPNLEPSDFQLMQSCLADKSPDVAHVAQRAVSDLTLLKRADSAGAYETLPANLPPPVEGAPSHKIETRPETIDGQKYLDIRWSDADLTQAWFKSTAASGAWDTKLHRFLVP